MADKKKSRQQLSALLEQAAQEVEKNPDSVPDHIYKTFEAICSVFYAWRHSNGQEGWAKNLEGKDGPLFSDSEGKFVENSFGTVAEFLKSHDLGHVQKGGALPAGFPPVIPTPNFAMPADMQIDPKDVSLDAAYFALQKKLGDYDIQWKEISDALGVVQAVQSGPDIRGIVSVPPVIPPIPYIIPRRTILPLASYAVEMLRVWLTVLPGDSSTFRFITSLLQFTLDTIRGDFKQAMLSLMGLFNKTGMGISVAGRFFVNLAELVSPDLRRQLSLNIYKSTKSLLIGSVLWMFATFAPDALRTSMEQFFDKIRQSVVEFNQKMDEAGAQIQQAASAAGVEVKMKHISEAGVPSLDDIQNLQMMIRIPEVACSTEMRQIIEPMIAIPPLRLVLDLMNLPTTPEDVEETCGGVSKSLTESAVEFVKPEITLPEMPAIPAVGAIPGMPQMPALGAIPGMPQMPAVGAIPGMPQMPAVGAIPGMPQMPAMAMPTATTMMSQAMPQMPPMAQMVAAVAGGSRKRRTRRRPTKY